MLLLLLSLTLFYAVKGLLENKTPGEKQSSGLLKQAVRQELTKQMSVTFMPVLSFLEATDAASDPVSFLEASIHKRFPVYYYSEYLSAAAQEIEDHTTRDLLIRQEGSDEHNKNISEEELDYEDNALHIEGSISDSMLEENTRYQEEVNSEHEILDSQQVQEASSFLPAPYPSFSYDWSEEWTYENLISNFYAVDSSTAVTNDLISLSKLLNQDMTVSKDKEGPQILIYHTHSQEAFADSVPGDTSTTIVGAGERLASILEEVYGFRVLHHTGTYDVESRDYAYNNALPEIEEVLKANPSIEVVIDLHRDAMQAHKKLLVDIQGRPTARFMFFNGLSHTRQSGDISYLPNPYIQDNLALSFQAQVAANEYYPGIARKIYLKAYRYNMHLAPKTLLIELGAQTNTVEEIMNACEPLAHILSIVLSGEG